MKISIDSWHVGGVKFSHKTYKTASLLCYEIPTCNTNDFKMLTWRCGRVVSLICFALVVCSESLSKKNILLTMILDPIDF